MYKRIDREEKYPQLPDKIIFYILSYLPLSCLFKFRCVCKRWNTLFLHPHLAFLNFRNSQSGPYLDDITGSLREIESALKDLEYEDTEGVEFSVAAWSSQGLCLQKFASIHQHSYSTNKLRYRVECSILRQTLEIPNPQYPSLCIALDSEPVKLVSVHEHGYEILSLGVGSDKTTYCWRDVNLPNLLSKKRNGIQIFFRMRVAYCIWHIDDPNDMEIDVLDMVNETYIGHNTFPKGLFTSTSYSLMDWNGQLSFVEQVKDELHVLILSNDCRQLKWDETTRVIKLNFLKPDNEELMTYIALADKNLSARMTLIRNIFILAYCENASILLKIPWM